MPQQHNAFNIAFPHQGKPLLGRALPIPEDQDCVPSTAGHLKVAVVLSLNSFPAVSAWRYAGGVRRAAAREGRSHRANSYEAAVA